MVTGVTIFILSIFALSHAAANNFVVKDGKIFDPRGVEFVMKGANVQAWNSPWEGDVLNDLEQFDNCWNFNTARVYFRLHKRGDTWPGHTKEKYIELVDSLTARGIVCVLAGWDHTGGYWSGGDLSAMIDFFKMMAQRHADNPHVWFETGNEPGGSGSNQSAWLKQHRSVITALRDDVGTKNIIVCSDDHWGQGAGGGSGSAVRKWGEDVIAFNGKTYENIIFTFHVYDQWKGGPESRARSYFDFHRSKGWVTFIGEYGVDNVGSNTQGASQGVLNVAYEYKVGRVVWHWFGGDDNKLFEGTNTGTYKIGWRGSAIDMSTCGSDNPVATGQFDIGSPDYKRTYQTEFSFPLTWLGKTVWDDNHREEQLDTLPGYSVPAAPLTIHSSSVSPFFSLAGGDPFTVVFSHTTPHTVRIATLDGRPVYSVHGRGKRATVNNTLSPGVYILNVLSPGGSSARPITIGSR
jgi:hypothetical protein